MTEHPGWTALQLAELLRRADRLLPAGLAIVRDISPELDEDDEPILSLGDVERLHTIADELADLAGQMQELAQRLPDRDLSISGEAVTDGAVADLSRGIIDPHRAMLAARALPVDVGWRTLADALSTGDTWVAWGRITVAGLLAAFRGADEQEVERVVAAARIPPDTAFAACDGEQIARLASALREHAGVG